MIQRLSYKSTCGVAHSVLDHPLWRSQLSVCEDSQAACGEAPVARGPLDNNHLGELEADSPAPVEL